MRKSCLYSLLSIALLISSCENNSTSNQNNGILDTDHFAFVLYDGLSESQFENVLIALEHNYQRILTDLEVSNIERITVKIWNDYDHFLDDMENDIGTRYTGATGYIMGTSEIRMYNTGNMSLTAVHEFAHVVSLYVNPTISNNPRWLWEAIAEYESQDFTDPSTLPYLESEGFPTLDELSTDYNSSNHYIYDLGYVLLQYIIVNWDHETMIRLIEQNGNIINVLGISVQEFEYGWYAWIEQTYL